MVMKRVYIKPNVLVVKSCLEGQLLSESGGQLDDCGSKGHNSFWDDWNEDEEEKPMFQQSKSLWD